MFERIPIMAADDQIQNQPDRSYWERILMEEIRNYISANLQTDLRAATVAEKQELSMPTLRRLFKKYQAQSYNRYIKEVRLKKAFELITKEGYRVQQAMYATGYKYKSTFNKAFKRKFKYPPGHFQK